MSGPGQSTDIENSKPLVTATNAGDDLKQTLNKSSQEIARDRSNQNTVGGSGGKNPGATIK